MGPNDVSWGGGWTVPNPKWPTSRENARVVTQIVRDRGMGRDWANPITHDPAFDFHKICQNTCMNKQSPPFRAGWDGARLITSRLGRAGDKSKTSQTKMLIYDVAVMQFPQDIVAPKNITA